MTNPNLQLLTDAAKLLEPILGELVFVGGCATTLLITDKAAADVRPLRTIGGNSSCGGRCARRVPPACHWVKSAVILRV
jgi:hypothetical protein